MASKTVLVEIASMLNPFKDGKQCNLAAETKKAFVVVCAVWMPCCLHSWALKVQMCTERRQPLPKYCEHLAPPSLTATEMQHAADAEHGLVRREWRPRCMPRS